MTGRDALHSFTPAMTGDFPTDASPERTSILVVGLETYGEDESEKLLPLPGVASHAIRFAKWWISRNVPSERIRIACTWARDAEELPAGTVPTPGTTDGLVQTLLSLLQEGGDLLVIYWCGHGVAQRGARTVFTSNATDMYLLNLPTESVREILAFDHGEGFTHQVLMFDACANQFEDLSTGRKLPAAPVPDIPPRNGVKQLLYFSTDVGRIAPYDRRLEEAAFSTALLRWLESRPTQYPPDFSTLRSDVESILISDALDDGKPPGLVVLAVRGFDRTEVEHVVPVGAGIDPYTDPSAFVDAIAETVRNELIFDQTKRLTDLGEMDIPWSLHTDRLSLNSGVLALCATIQQNHSKHVVLVGASKSGKTTMALLLAAQLAPPAQVSPQFPLPIPFSFKASWNPKDEGLIPWMVRSLRERLSAIAEYPDPTLYAAIRSGLILPVFDGFDEISSSLQPEAARLISAYFSETSAILTSQLSQDLMPTLPGIWPEPLFVFLHQLPFSEMYGYLLKFSAASGVRERERWRNVLDSASSEEEHPVLDALTSPLMAWLAKTTFGFHGSSEIHDPARDPATLFGQGFVTRSQVETYLLRGLVRSVFARDSSVPGSHQNSGPDAKHDRSFDPRSAEKHLAFLAAHGAEGRIALWDFRTLAPLAAIGYGVETAVALCVLWLTLAGSTGGLLICVGQIAGLILGFGFAIGYSTGRAAGIRDKSRVGYHTDDEAPSHRYLDGSPGEHLRRFLRGLSIVAVSFVGIVVALPFLTADDLDTFARSGEWAALAVLVTAIVSFPGGRVAAVILKGLLVFDLKVGARAVDPHGVVRGDRLSGTGMLVLGWVLVSSLLVASQRFAFESWESVEFLWCGVAGVGAAVVATVFWNQWAKYRVAHGWLMAAGWLPRRLSAFFTAAEHNQILGAFGRYYVYKHESLRDALVGIHRDLGGCRRDATTGR